MNLLVELISVCLVYLYNLLIVCFQFVSFLGVLTYFSFLGVLTHISLLDLLR